MTSPGKAEWCASPDTVLVHNPVPIGAFDGMDDIDDEERLQSTLLFRERPDVRAYSGQHDALVALLRQHVDNVLYLRDLVGQHESFKAAATNPNQVFTRDSLITLPWLPDAYIAARMAKPVRRFETATMETAVKKLGLRELISIPEHLHLEGGDVVPFSLDGRRTLVVGYGQRTRLKTLYHLQESLIPHYADDIIGIELASWRINLDGGFLPVAEDVVVANEESILSAIHLYAQKRETIDVFELLRKRGTKVIDVTVDESVFSQACNCFCLGARKVICYDLAPRVYEALKRHDVEVYRTPGSELVKGRGGPRCMTRPIYQAPPVS